MKTVNYVVILLVVIWGFFINYMYMDRNENFYIELNKQAEILNDRIDRILYVKVLQEEDAELKWDSWKWERDKELSTTLRIEYGLEFTDTFSNDRYLTGNEGLYLMGDVVIFPDQFSGNTYVINAEGDTIFKYIKREKE